MRILVTGGSGFIGSHLRRKLEAHGYRVRNVDLRDEQMPIDITDYERLKGAFRSFKPNIVVHLAAVASVPLCERDPELAYKVNVIGTLNVVRIAKKLRSRVIYPSSSTVYGNPKRLPTPEGSPPTPINYYGTTKAIGEHITMQSHNHVIFRIFNAYGPHCHGSYVIPDTIRKIKGGHNPVPMEGTGEESRDFVYIDDVIKGFMTAIENEDISGTYNLGTGTTTRIKDLVKLIGKLTGKPNIRFKFKGVLRLGDFKTNKADIRNAIRDLKWRPNVPLKEGLKRTIEST